MKNAIPQKLQLLFGLLLAAVVVTVLLSASFCVSIQYSGNDYRFAGLQDEKFQSNMSDFDRKLKQALDEAAENRKIILYWHPKERSTTKPSANLTWNCGSCILSSNSSKIQEKLTAAVVFHHSVVKPKLMPSKFLRRPDQLYVWFNLESSANLLVYRRKTFAYEDLIQFNATMTYRRDSDIFLPYGPLTMWLQEKNLTKIMEQKSRIGIAVVSDCDTTPGAKIRRKYLKAIAAKFPIDLFGRCFKHLNISRSANFSLSKMLFVKYKFYFAFENSYHCRDYITEKFYLNALGGNTLPVVWGASRADYEAAMPSDAFIHVEDFPTLDALVKYLKYLNKNDSAYLEHFRWRKDFKEDKFRTETSGYCQLCRIINGINVDDVHRSDYNSSSPMKPKFANSAAYRTISPLKQWMQKDNADCFRRNLRLNSNGKVI